MPTPPNNTTLIQSAETRNLAANNQVDTFESGAIGTAFIIDNANTVNVGDDIINGFKKSDSILTTRALFDSNGDKIIDFGSTLQSDRTSTSKSGAGADDITINGLDSHALRYLGMKDGYFAYADASVKLTGFTEGTVNDDKLSGAGGAKTFFFDNALGLNLGKDTINNFGADDRLVFTTKLFDSNDDNGLNFGANKLLDVSGAKGPLASDPKMHVGGQIDLNGVDGGDITDIVFQGSQVENGVTYYYYGLGLIEA